MSKLLKLTPVREQQLKAAGGKIIEQRMGFAAGVPTQPGSGKSPSK